MTPKLLQGATFAAADSGRGTACCTGTKAIWIICVVQRFGAKERPDDGRRRNPPLRESKDGG